MDIDEKIDENIIDHLDNDVLQKNIEQCDELQANTITSTLHNTYTQFELVHKPTCLTTYELTAKNNFFKGCKWSPDGSCLMTCSNDKTIRLFNLPAQLTYPPIVFEDNLELTVELQVKEGGLIYDYCFNPNLNSADRASCFLLTTSHGSPIHMFDAYTGHHLNNYVAYTDTEEETFAHSVLVNPVTNRLYGGYKDCIRFFDLTRPGRYSDKMDTYYEKTGQQGLITCLAVNPSNTDIIAAGSYGKQLALYSESEMKQICVLLGHYGGLTQLKFSYDGTKLFTGSRCENEIFCWDIRYLSEVLFTLKRDSSTNQRIYFDTNFYTNYLVSGNLDGKISVFDLKQIESTTNNDTALDAQYNFTAHLDCVNGVSLHPFYPLLASCSGQRKFKQLDETDQDENIFKTMSTYENSLKLWWLTDVQQYNSSFENQITTVKLEEN